MKCQVRSLHGSVFALANHLSGIGVEMKGVNEQLPPAVEEDSSELNRELGQRNPASLGSREIHGELCAALLYSDIDRYRVENNEA